MIFTPSIGEGKGGNMALSLNHFVENEESRIAKFKSWYIRQSKSDPDGFPLTMPTDNEGHGMKC